MWLETYRRLPAPNQAEGVLDHTLFAFDLWLSRVLPDRELPTGSLENRLRRGVDDWLTILDTTPPESVISYRNLTDQPFEATLGAIAGHVINHGTYHRGQLRAIAEEQGFVDFPETDLFLFLSQNRLYALPTDPPG